jgi:hypothetical protein
MDFAPQLDGLSRSLAALPCRSLPGPRDRVKPCQGFTFGHPLPKGAREFPLGLLSLRFAPSGSKAIGEP